MATPTLAQLLQRATEGTLSPAARRRLDSDARLGAQRMAARLRAAERKARDEQDRLDVLLHFERHLWDAGVRAVAGVDEAGSGPLAGPVFAAAVVLHPHRGIVGIDDSKRLSAGAREELSARIREEAAAWAIGSCSAAEIDTMNIYQAAREAMRRAVVALAPPAEHLLVDARQVPGVATPQTPLIKGDSRSQSIAAASVLAKVARDALMQELEHVYPGYGFAQHKGYSTAAHLAALEALGPCAIHRRSFEPVRQRGLF